MWAYVGHGTSDNLHLVKDVKHGEGEGYSIIVSRSHSGSVEPIAKKSFGDNTKVIPAGGAGKWLHEYYLFSVKLQSIMYMYANLYQTIF